jgi:hypothetical protein
MPLNFGGGNSSSSSLSAKQLQQQLQPYFIDRSGDTINATSDTITTVPNPVNPQDPVNLQYLQANSISSTSANSSYLRLDGTNYPSANIPMNNFKLTGLIGGNSTSATDSANMGNVNAVVNIICGVQGGTAKQCITQDGTIGMNGNLNLNSNKVVSLANPVNATDAVNLQYLQSNTVNSSINMISTNIMFGSSSANPTSKVLTISNSAFSTSNILIRLICYVMSSVTYTDTYGMTVSSPSFSAGTFTFTATITRTDSNTSWGQGLQIATVLFYK